MNEKQSDGHQNNTNEEELSLVGLFLAIKRNNKILFTVVLISFAISLFVAYNKSKPDDLPIVDIENQEFITKYVLRLQGGMLINDNLSKVLVEAAATTHYKIDNVYIPKVTAELMKPDLIKSNPLKFELEQGSGVNVIGIYVTKTTDEIDYSEILLKIASYVLKDQNSIFESKDMKMFKPARIIQKPIKVESIKIDDDNSRVLIIIPILGIIIGFFIGLFFVFINEFLNKVKEIEKLTD